jgi:hypothetical protein
VSDDLIVAEVVSTPELAPGAELPITHWLLSALRFKPYLVDRYYAELRQKRRDLIARWTRGSEEHGSNSPLQAV